MIKTLNKLFTIIRLVFTKSGGCNHKARDNKVPCHSKRIRKEGQTNDEDNKKHFVYRTNDFYSVVHGKLYRYHIAQLR